MFVQSHALVGLGVCIDLMGVSKELLHNAVGSKLTQSDFICVARSLGQKKRILVHFRL